MCALAVVGVLGSVSFLARNTDAPSDPPISWSGSGRTEGAILYRDDDQRLAAVAVVYQPSGDGPVHCELIVGGEVVRDTAAFGYPATCVWVNGVHWDGAPNEPRTTL